MIGNKQVLILEVNNFGSSVEQGSNGIWLLFEWNGQGSVGY